MSTIVWIDDDAAVLSAVVRPLERRGHSFVTIRTTDEALSSINTLRSADLILLDIVIPGTPLAEVHEKYAGVALLRHLRCACDVTTPVIVFSVVRQPELVSLLHNLAVTEVLMKPLLPSRLFEVVERALASR
jgi:CheY-like chemotaxis protein